MRVLKAGVPTDEQLRLLDYQPGFALIRGSVGSGKTSTAVLRLKHVSGVWTGQRRRTGDATPISALVLTFNRTLRGYIQELVLDEVEPESLDLTMKTFGQWAYSMLGFGDVLQGERDHKLWALGKHLGYSSEFLCDEVTYVLGRYLPGDVDEYITQGSPTYERTGRGTRPRMERPARVRLLEEVVRPYIAWKEENGTIDWEDVSVMMATRAPAERYDIVLVDEAQDFSANQIRGVVRHLAEEHSTTFVLDAVQRIYPHGFATWAEVGAQVRASYRLTKNHRNTEEIAAFARPLVAGLPVGDDGTLPDLESCDRSGPLPKIVSGLFRDQMTWLVEYIESLPVDDSIALLHLRGGGYFSYVRTRLRQANIPFVEMQSNADWPEGAENVGLITLHSSKGLEFDHVVVLGLNGEFIAPEDEDEEEDEEDDGGFEQTRRLVAVAITRARQTATWTYKLDDPPVILDYLEPDTYERVDL